MAAINKTAAAWKLATAKKDEAKQAAEKRLAGQATRPTARITMPVPSSGKAAPEVRVGGAQMKQAQSFTPAPAAQEAPVWTPGEYPSTRDVLAQIVRVGQEDRARGDELLEQFYQLQQDKGSPYYNPYGAATNVKAIQALADYRQAKESNDQEAAGRHLERLENNFPYFGYGFIANVNDLIPPIGLTFYSFHIMVLLGGYFILLFVVVLYYGRRERLASAKWLQYVLVWSIPLGYIAGQAGWIVAEVGRQPWAIQDLLPTNAAISALETSSVQVTFFLFLALFTILLFAEIRIMVKAIRKGPEMSTND